MNEKIKVLLINNKPKIVDFLKHHLTKENYFVEIIDDEQNAIQNIYNLEPDLIVLDIIGPNMDGIETCNKLRNLDCYKTARIIFFTAQNKEYYQIAAFEAGADDYIIWPIKPKVFLKRISALLKRFKPTEIKSGKEEELIINKEKFLVEYKGKKISLPKKEFELLYLLVSKPNVVFTRETIYDAVWNKTYSKRNRNVDILIRKLRMKICNGCIKTVKGVGYKYNPI